MTKINKHGQHINADKSNKRSTTLGIVVGMMVILLTSSVAVLPPASANHTQRAEWETHGGGDNIGGLRSTIKVQSPSVSSCNGNAFPCTHTMVYAYSPNEGYIGAGWIKFKNAGGNQLLYGLVHYKDFGAGIGFYVLTKDLSSKVGQSLWFDAKKQNYDSNNDCWYGVTDGWVESRCIGGMTWGHPRVVGRLNDNVVTFGTSIGSLTNVKNRAQTSETWIEMGSSSFENYCIETTYTDIHEHHNINGYYTFHIGPPFTESDNCSDSATPPTDLGG